MTLPASIEDLIDTVASRAKRVVLVLVATIVFGLAALYQLATALLIALEPQAGLIGARLIMAGLYLIALLLVMVAAGLARRAERRRRKEAELNAARSAASAGLIMEAAMMGYSLSRRLRS